MKPLPLERLDLVLQDQGLGDALGSRGLPQSGGDSYDEADAWLTHRLRSTPVRPERVDFAPRDLDMAFDAPDLTLLWVENASGAGVLAVRRRGRRRIEVLDEGGAARIESRSAMTDAPCAAALSIPIWTACGPIDCPKPWLPSSTAMTSFSVTVVTLCPGLSQPSFIQSR